MSTKRCTVWAFLIGTLAGVAAFGQSTAYGGAHGSAAGYAAASYQRGPSASAEVGFFYDELSPYGTWTAHSQYGWVWRPHRVHAGWRPYSMGRWVDSDYGWTWVSDEPFGWATYHYGRWAWDPSFGWVWIPGTVWGPAWVSWQQGGGYVGWAPLPPSIGFQAGIGLHLGGLDLNLILQPRDYSFVEERSFLEPHVTRYFAAPTRNTTIYRQTTNITRYNVEGNRVINQGVPIDRIERATHRRVERLRIAESQNQRSTGVERDQVRIYRAPESRLRTVRVAERNNAGVRAETPPVRRGEKEATPRAKGDVQPRPEPPAGVREKPQAQPQEATRQERLDRQEARRQRDEAAARQKEQQKPRPVREPQAQPQQPPPHRERQVQPPPERREERAAKPQPPPQPKAKPQDQKPPQEKAKKQEPPKERKPPQGEKPKHKPHDEGPPPPAA